VMPDQAVKGKENATAAWLLEVGLRLRYGVQYASSHLSGEEGGPANKGALGGRTGVVRSLGACWTLGVMGWTECSDTCLPRLPTKS
jgi:hypothetical protein